MFIIVFYMAENGGIGEKIMRLACPGAEISRFYICPYMGISPIMKNRNISAPGHASLIIFSPIPPFSTM